MIDSGDRSLTKMVEMLPSVELIKSVPHEEMVALYHHADIVITDMQIGALPTTSVEAMACGRPVIQYMRHDVHNEIPVRRIGRPSDVSLFEAVCAIGENEINEMASAGRRYVEEVHDARKIAKRIGEIYEEVARR